MHSLLISLRSMVEDFTSTRFRSQIALWAIVDDWNRRSNCFLLSWSVVLHSTHGIQFFDWRNSAPHLAFIDYTIPYRFDGANRQLNSMRVFATR